MTHEMNEPNPQAHIIFENYCPFCGRRNLTRVNPKAYYDWFTLRFPIQVAMADLSPVKRETIMTGTCSVCQDHIFREEEEDEEESTRDNVRQVPPSY